MAAITQKERLRRERMARSGELDQCWVTLTDGRLFFAHKTNLRPHGLVFHTRDGLIDAQVEDIVKAVH